MIFSDGFGWCWRVFTEYDVAYHVVVTVTKGGYGDLRASELDINIHMVYARYVSSHLDTVVLQSGWLLNKLEEVMSVTCILYQP